MKRPFIDYELYCKTFPVPKVPEASVARSADKIKTTSRSTTIINKFVGKTFSIHNGKTAERIVITSEMIGQKLGSFVLTKKLGKSIHNSDNNRKKREKARRKITQKKVRKKATVSKNGKAKITKKK